MTSSWNYFYLLVYFLCHCHNTESTRAPLNDARLESCLQQHVIHNSHFASSLFVIKPIQGIEMWKLTSAQEDEVGEQRKEETKRQWKGERMGERKKEDRNAGAWSLLPLRQHCLGTASLSAIINNSAAPVSRLCFMHIRTLVHTHTHTQTHTHTHTHTHILYKYIYLRFSFSISSSSCTLRTFFGYAMNTLNTVAWLYLWTGWTRSIYVCVGPFKRDSTRDGEKRTGETYRGSLRLVDRDCIAVDFGS